MRRVRNLPFPETQEKPVCFRCTRFQVDPVSLIALAEGNRDPSPAVLQKRNPISREEDARGRQEDLAPGSL